jgi:hypothetical protein
MGQALSHAPHSTHLPATWRLRRAHIPAGITPDALGVYLLHPLPALFRAEFFEFVNCGILFFIGFPVPGFPDEDIVLFRIRVYAGKAGGAEHILRVEGEIEIFPPDCYLAVLLRVLEHFAPACEFLDLV